MNQEEAARRLHIEEPTTLSKYENGHLKVDDKLVKQMALLYRNEKLVLLHIDHVHPELSEYIPKLIELRGDCEHITSLELAHCKIKAAKKRRAST